MSTVTRAAALILSSIVGVAHADTLEQPLLGSAAPSFRLPALAGEPVALADQRGKLVVLHFGAGW